MASVKRELFLKPFSTTIEGPKFSTPKRDGLELPDLQYSIIESRSDHGGSARGIGITRKSSTIFFGFVPVGDSQVIDHKIYNRTSEQMRLKCSLLHRSEVFMILSSETLIVQPNSDNVVSIMYKPMKYSQNENILRLERLNGEFKTFTFKVCGFGGRSRVEFSQKHFDEGLALTSVNGTIVYTPQFFPPPPSSASTTCSMELVNNGERTAFVCVRGIEKTGEFLDERFVRIRPNRCVIDAGGKSKCQTFTITITNAYSMQRKMAKNDCSVMLEVIWGEERQRSSYARWLSQRGEKLLVRGEDFSLPQYSESRSKKLTAAERKEDDVAEQGYNEFKDSIRIMKINIIDNRLIAIYNLD